MQFNDRLDYDQYDFGAGVLGADLDLAAHSDWQLKPRPVPATQQQDSLQASHQAAARGGASVQQHGTGAQKPRPAGSDTSWHGSSSGGGAVRVARTGQDAVVQASAQAPQSDMSAQASLQQYYRQDDYYQYGGYDGYNYGDSYEYGEYGDGYYDQYGYGQYGQYGYGDRDQYGYNHNGGRVKGRDFRDFMKHVREEKRPGALHCGVCCPHTNITVEVREGLGQRPDGSPDPVPDENDDVVEPDPGVLVNTIIVNASCPLAEPSNPGYSTICKHDNVSNLQIGGYCVLDCWDPRDYLAVMPVRTGWTGGCADCDNSRTTCSYVAINPPLDNGTNAEPYYRGTCNVTAVAECCKQLCKKKPHHPKPHYSYGYPHGGPAAASAAGVVDSDDSSADADADEEQGGGFKAVSWGFDGNTQQQQQQQQQSGGVKHDWHGDGAGRSSSKTKGAHAGQQQQQKQKPASSGGVPGAFRGKQLPAGGETSKQFVAVGQGQGGNKLAQKAQHGGASSGAMGSVSNRQGSAPNSKSKGAAAKQRRTGSKDTGGFVQDADAPAGALGQGNGDGSGPGVAYGYAGVHGVNQNAPAAPAAPPARKQVQYRQAYMAPTAA